MNLVLTHCWQQWRAQRGMLAGFLGLGIAALCLVFTLVPEHYWLEDGRRALALSWFVVIGGVGVLAFAAPALVRTEFGPKGDQFVRRLPGALRPSFGGKLLFLLLATLAMPLLGLAAGELFLTGNGQGWHDLFRWDHAGEVCFELPWPVLWLGQAALLVPWVWAIGTWLPNGRMALGGSIVFWLLQGALVTVALRLSPGMLPTLPLEPWFAALSAYGFVVAGVSWLVGRRGGGAWRSARCGLLTTAIGMLPPLLWLAARTYDYHHPDPQQLEELRVTGISPDHRYLLASGQSRASYQWHLDFRIDLQDGSAVQLGGVGTNLRPDLLRPTTFMMAGQARWFGGYDGSVWTDRITGYRVFDLQTGTWIAHANQGDAAAMQKEALRQMRSRLSPQEHGPALFAPDGVRVWFDGNDLCFARADRSIERSPWVGPLPVTVRPRGHGFVTYGKTEQWFDLTTRTAVRIDDQRNQVFFVRGVMLCQRHLRAGVWLRRDAANAEFREVPELARADVIGLVDDDHVLCRRSSKTTCELFTWHVGTGAVQAIAVPASLVGRSLALLAPMHQHGSLLPRDPAGNLWWLVTDPNRGDERLLRWDPAARGATLLPLRLARHTMLLAWLDADTALLQEAATIQRLSVTTGARTQLFPRR
jgi:hypothetical protein